MKNLNAVLNDVMNDIMTEGIEEYLPDFMKLPADRMASAEGRNVKLAGEKIAQALAPEERDLSAELGQSAPIQEVPLGPKTSAPASLLGRASAEAQYQAAMNNQNAGLLNKAGAALGYGLDRAKLAAQGLGDQIGTAWDNATPMERGLAIGIPTALAAGAGALYLRKKQREANKAAGR